MIEKPPQESKAFCGDESPVHQLHYQQYDIYVIHRLSYLMKIKILALFIETFEWFRVW